MHTARRALRRYFTRRDGCKVAPPSTPAQLTPASLAAVALLSVVDLLRLLVTAPTREGTDRIAKILVLVFAIVMAWRMPWTALLQ